MNIQQYLSWKNISATAFAEKAGVQPSTITRIINGDIPQPRLATQRKIIAASDKNIQEIDFLNLSITSTQKQIDTGNEGEK
ncbi:MAG: helix-turn-helix transcriptional regulator [Sneathiella sp.]